MGRELTLIQRLRRIEEGQDTGEHTARQNTELLLSSIQDNLRRILNSREGFAPAQPDYGAPTPNEIIFGFPDAIVRMQRHIKSGLERYEPRLTGVQVFHVENPDDRLTLLFHVRARLQSEHGSTSVSFVTKMDGSGRLTVRR